MANIYGLLQTGQTPPFYDPNAPGYAIMTTGAAPNDVPSLFTAFCRYFRQLHPRTWIGGAVTPSAEDILDGAKTTGQCYALARAFRKLAICPAPYGLGLPENQFGAPNALAGGQYNGEHGNGFVSDHRDNLSPAGTVLSLVSNVFTLVGPPDPLVLVGGASPRSGLYLWENHKTVPYQGLYYDVLYERIWANKQQMAQYNLHAGNPQKRIQYDAQRKQYTTSFMPADGPNGIVYFRDLLEVEINALGAVGYQGRYAALPGAPWFERSGVADIRRKFGG